MNSFLGEYLQGDCFEKPIQSLYPCHQIIETEEQLRFFFHLNNQISLYLWLYWNILNLVKLIHGYSYLISLEIAVEYRKLRGSQETQTNLSILLEKTDITYPSRNF